MVRWGAIWGLIAAFLYYWTQGGFGRVGLIETLLLYGLAGTAFGFSLKQVLRTEWHKLETQKLEQKTRLRVSEQAAPSEMSATTAAPVPVSTAELPSVEAILAAHSTAVQRAGSEGPSQLQQQGQPQQALPEDDAFMDGLVLDGQAFDEARAASDAPVPVLPPPLPSTDLAGASSSLPPDMPPLPGSVAAMATVAAAGQAGAVSPVPSQSTAWPDQLARHAAHDTRNATSDYTQSASVLRKKVRSKARTHTQANVQADKGTGLLQAVWGWFAGGNVITRIGVLMLFFGLAFLAKFAAQAGYFPPAVRLSAVGITGIGLFITGFVLRGKALAAGHALHQTYAHTLQGAGVGVLYLTIVAAVRLYSLLPSSVALGLLVLIVAFAASIALMQNSLSMAFIGALGGFAAPLLVSTGSENFVGLFTYYALLNFGIVAMVRRRNWQVLHVLGFVCTFGVLALWLMGRYVPEHYMRIQPFVLLFSVLYLWAHISDRLRNGLNRHNWADGLLLFGNMGITLWVQMVITGHLPYGRAFSALALAALYLGMSAWVLRQANQARAGHARRPIRALAQVCWMFGVACLILMVPLALSARHTAMAWAVMGAVLYLWGLRQRRDGARLLAVLLHALAAISAWVSVGRYADAPAISTMWPHLPMLLCLAACAGVMARGAYRQQVQLLLLTQQTSASANTDQDEQETVQGSEDLPDLHPRRAAKHARHAAQPRHGWRDWMASTAQLLDAHLPNAMLVWGALLWLLAGVVQIHFDNPDALYLGTHWVGKAYRPHAVLLLCVGTAFALHRLGLRDRIWPLRSARALAWLALPCMLLFALLVMASSGHWLKHGGWWVWPAVLLMHGVMLRRLDGSTQRQSSRTWYISHVGGITLVLLLLGNLLHEGVKRWGLRHTAWEGAVWLVAGMVILLGLARVRGFEQTFAHVGSRRAQQAAWPWRSYGQAYLVTGAGGLALLLAVGSLLNALFSSGVAQPLPYVPVLNPTDLSVLLALAVCALWVRRVQHFGALQGGLGGRQLLVDVPWSGVLGGLGFVIVNTIWLRTAHHYGQVPWRADALFGSFLVQAGYSVLWGVIALVLMVQAHRKALRTWWMSGAALLGLTVLKLLTVDLSNSGGKERIVSFIAVGALMLVVGYFVPLPPKGSKPPEYTPLDDGES